MDRQTGPDHKPKVSYSDPAYKVSKTKFIFSFHVKCWFINNHGVQYHCLPLKVVILILMSIFRILKVASNGWHSYGIKPYIRGKALENFNSNDLQPNKHAFDYSFHLGR